MANLDDAYNALRAADAAGDAESVRALIAYIEGASNEATMPNHPVIRQNTLQQDIAEEMQNQGWLGRQAAGFGSSAADTYYALKQMTTGLSKEDEQNIKNWRSIKEEAPIGNIAGSLAQFAIPSAAAMKIPMVAKAIAGGGAKAGATIAGASGLTSAAQSGLTPTLDDESRARNMMLGGAVGAVAPAAVGAMLKGTQAVARPIVGMFSGNTRKVIAGNVMAEAAGRKSATEVGDDYERVLDRLLESKTGLISKQSAGQAAVDAEVPTFSALQAISDAYKTLPSEKLSTLQESARIKALRTIGRDAPDVDLPKTNLNLAIASREKSADNLYGKAFSADDMRIDSVANRLASAKGGIGQVSPADVPIDSRVAHLQNDRILSDISSRVERSDIGGFNPLASLRGLDLMKKTIDADLVAIKSGKETSLKNVNESSLVAAKSKLLAAMEDLSPSYREARTKYADLSVPVNRMQVGQVLEEALSGTLGAGERAAVFANKIKAAEQIIKKTTGQQRYDSLSKLFDKRQMGIVDNVLNELKINETYKRQALKGAQEQARKMGVTLSEGKIPNTLNTAVTLTNSLLSRITGVNKDRTINMIADLMQDPKVAAETMQFATAKEKAAIKFLINAQKKTALAVSTVIRAENKSSED